MFDLHAGVHGALVPAVGLEVLLHRVVRVVGIVDAVEVLGLRVGRAGDLELLRRGARGRRRVGEEVLLLAPGVGRGRGRGHRDGDGLGSACLADEDLGLGLGPGLGRSAGLSASADGLEGLLLTLCLLGGRLVVAGLVLLVLVVLLGSTVFATGGLVLWSLAIGCRNRFDLAGGKRNLQDCSAGGSIPLRLSGKGRKRFLINAVERASGIKMGRVQLERRLLPCTCRSSLCGVDESSKVGLVLCLDGINLLLSVGNPLGPWDLGTITVVQVCDEVADELEACAAAGAFEVLLSGMALEKV